MKATVGPESQERSSVLTNGVADLMTSLAVIFVLLLVAYIARVGEGMSNTVSVRLAQTEIQPRGELPTSDPETKEPSVLAVTVPDAALQFDFGKSTLLPSTETFLAEAIPHYASMICGQSVEAFVIEGYTDDLGDDLQNLRLSQERSFAVLAKSLEIVREKLPEAYECFLQKAMANGRGKQSLLRNEEGRLDREKSRRVMFKLHMRPM